MEEEIVEVIELLHADMQVDRQMEEKIVEVIRLLYADEKVDRRLERLPDVKTLTEIIHDYREKDARSCEIALAIVKFAREA